MIGALAFLIAPFAVSNEVSYERNCISLVLWGLIVDLVSGVTLGLTSLLLIGHLLIIYFYSRKFTLGTTGKLIIGVAGAIVYFYVSRRFFR